MGKPFAPVVAVVGARNHGNPSKTREVIEGLEPDTVVVSGGADGVASMAIEAARARSLTAVELHADWQRFGERAEIMRNAEVVAAVDAVVALPWWGCVGTWDTVRRAKEAGIPCRVVPPVSELDVWTVRLSRDVVDDDIFVITRASAAAHRPSASWQSRNRDKRIMGIMREAEAQGVSLPAIQRRLRDGGAPAINDPWAPPFSILKPVLDMRVKAKAARANGRGDEALAIEEAAWATYEPAFMNYIRSTFKTRSLLWGWLLSRRRVVLACPCHDPARCHRSLVAKALVGCGATYHGELTKEKQQLDIGVVVS